MEILVRGSDPRKRYYRGSCKNCGTVVQAVHSELLVADGGTGRSVEYVVCPVCNHHIYPLPLGSPTGLSS